MLRLTLILISIFSAYTIQASDINQAFKERTDHQWLMWEVSIDKYVGSYCWSSKDSKKSYTKQNTLRLYWQQDKFLTSSNNCTVEIAPGSPVGNGMGLKFRSGRL